MKLYRINELDNVAVALENVAAGEILSTGAGEFKALTDVPAGHKIALEPIRSGEKIIKYGNAIGVATCDIEKGCHVHTQNIKTGLGDLLEYSYHPAEYWSSPLDRIPCVEGR